MSVYSFVGKEEFEEQPVDVYLAWLEKQQRKAEFFRHLKEAQRLLGVV